MVKQMTRALMALRGGSSSVRARFRDGYLCVRSGGLDGWGELVVELENVTDEEQHLDDHARVELHASGRKLGRVLADARELRGGRDHDFDGTIKPRGKVILRCNLVVASLEPDDEIVMKGRFESTSGAVSFSSPSLPV